MPSLVDTGAYLDQLYQEKFGRVPDAEGKAYWKKKLDAGTATADSVAAAFDASDEAKRVKESKAQEARDFLERTYAEELGRKPDTEGAEYWANEISSGRQTQEDVVNNIRQSDEYQERQEPAEDEWQQEYDNQLNQATNDLTRNDISREETTGEVAASGQDRRNTAGYTPALQEEELEVPVDPDQPVPGEEEGFTDQADAETTAFLNQVYREDLGREPDEEGLKYWKKELASGNQTEEDVLANIRRSDEYQERQEELQEEGRATDRDNADDFTFGGEEDFNNLYNDTFNTATEGDTTTSDDIAFSEEDDDVPEYGLPWLDPNSEEGKRNAINSIYQEVLERNADEGGSDYWYKELESGRQTLDDIRSNIAKSDEAANLESNKAFIEEQYQSGLDRGTQGNVDDAADPYGGGMGYWLKDLATGQSREDVASNIRRSDEFSTQAEDYLEGVYENILDRDPDDEGLTYWKEELASGNQTREEVAQNISQGDEKWLGDTYQAELGRKLGDEGREYWLNDMWERGQTREQVLANIRKSEEYLNKGEQECPTGQHLENGVCVNDAVTECPEGKRLENGVCVDDIRMCNALACPEGQIKNADCECVDVEEPDPEGECPEGLSKNEWGECVDFNAECPEGYTQGVNGGCVPGVQVMKQCPDGSVIPESETCPTEEDTTCPTGQTRNADGECEPEDTDDDFTGPCPEGQIRNAAGVCVAETIGGEEEEEDPMQCPDGYTRNESGACVEDPGTWTGEDPTDPGEEEEEEDIGNYMGEDPSDPGEEEEEGDIGNYMGEDPSDPGEEEEEGDVGNYMGGDPTEAIGEEEDETEDPLDTTKALNTTTALPGGLNKSKGSTTTRTTATGTTGTNVSTRTGGGNRRQADTGVRGDMGYGQARNEYRDLYNASLRDMQSLNDRGEEDRVRYGELESRYGKLRADYEAARREADSYRDANRADETSRLRSGITVGGAPGSRRNSLRSGNTATSDRSRRRGVSSRSNRDRGRSSSMQGIRSGF